MLVLLQVVLVFLIQLNLSTYKFSEDVFKKVTIVPDGKNHGLVFILDWSGSMNNVMMDTLKQLYNLNLVLSQSSNTL